MKRLFALIFLLASLALAGGCATLADAQAAKGSGKSRVYAKTYDQVWTVVVDTVRASGLVIAAENREKGSILAQGTASAFSWGENVAIFVEAAGGKDKTRVEVVNKRAVAANVTAADWEARILEALDKRL